MARSQNSLGMRFVRSGPPALVAVLNQIIAGFDAVQVRRSVDIDALTTAEGTLLSFRRELGEGSTKRTTATHPFQVLNASVTTPSPAAKVSVVFGQVNSVTPTIGTDFLGSLIGDPPAPPALTVVSGPVFLEVTVDASGLVTGVEVKNATSLPANTSTKGHITLAMVTVASNAVTAINQSVTHSLSHYKCGTTVHRFVAV